MLLSEGRKASAKAPVLDVRTDLLKALLLVGGDAFRERCDADAFNIAGADASDSSSPELGSDTFVPVLFMDT